MTGLKLVATLLVFVAAALRGVDGRGDAALRRRLSLTSQARVLKAGGHRVLAEAAFDVFKRGLGGVDNNNTAGPIEGGFRSINWDADVVPFDMPGDFFRNTVTRGMALATDAGEFRVSNPPATDPGYPDNLFDSINVTHPLQFQAFSPERIFSPLVNNSFEIKFSIPAANDAALVSAFGAIFVDVDNKDETFVEFYDAGGDSLGAFFVPAAPQGLSFLGVDFEEAVVAKIFVGLGSKTLDQGDLPPECDIVPMDDFLFSEPTARCLTGLRGS